MPSSSNRITNTPKFGGRSRCMSRPIIKKNFRKTYLEWLSREFPEIIIEYYNNLRINKLQCFCNDGFGNIICEDCEYQDSDTESEPDTEPESRERWVRSMAPSPEPVPEPEPEVTYNYEYNYVEHSQENGEYWYKEREEWW